MYLSTKPYLAALRSAKNARIAYRKRGALSSFFAVPPASVSFASAPTCITFHRDVNDTVKRSLIRSMSTTTIKKSLSSSTPDNKNATNGKYLEYSMLYHDSVAFLVSNQLGIPGFINQEEGGKATARNVATKFNLSVRGASAILVTLCRMDVVQVYEDSDESVDDIIYELTPSAQAFLSDADSPRSTNAFIDTLTTNFITPDALLECSRPEEQQDLMTAHLEESNEEVVNNARHFMAHMNAQSYSCAKAFPYAAGIATKKEPFTLLDIGGGSAIFPIEAASVNPNLHGIVYELPAIKPITEEYISKANLSDRITVHPGDFFKEDDSFPGPIDMVLFSNILHDWEDHKNVKLIEKAFNCLKPGGQIVINELLLANDVKSSTAAATSMNVIMLPYTKGRQYRPKELFIRLERAGFEGCDVVNLVDDYDLVIGTKPID